MEKVKKISFLVVMKHFVNWWIYKKEQILGKDINEIVPELCSKINKYDFFYP